MPIERELDERIERYLDGELSAPEALALEQELAGPEAAAVLSTALFLREALREAGPVEPPLGLQNRILEVLSLAPAPPAWESAREPTASASRARDWAAAARFAANGMMAYAWGGTALAVNGLSAGAAGTPGALAGLAAGRWVLGPLAAALAARRTEPKPTKRPWWRRLRTRREDG